MRREADETIFFEEQILEAEAPAELGDSGRNEGVDEVWQAPWNWGMATANAASGSTSLEERLSELGVERAKPATSEILGTGVGKLDEALEGGLRSGLLAEFVEREPSGGGQVLLLHLLAAMRREQRFVALVDGADAFDPQSTPNALLEHLLWVRCSAVDEAMKAADALLRDENLGMVLLDLRGCEERELRRVKSSAWYRLQRLAERSSGFACVLTGKPMVTSAQARVELQGNQSVESMDTSLPELSAGIQYEVTKLRKREREGFAKLVQRRAAG